MDRANISWVTDQIATGGDFALVDEVMQAQLSDLLDQGIALVIDCRLEDEGDDTELWQVVRDIDDSAPAYVHLPTDDAVGHHIEPGHFYAARDAALPVLNDGGRVFVHCHMGVNRGPSTAMFLLLTQGMSPEDAFDVIRERRPQAAVYYAEDALAAFLGSSGMSLPEIEARVGAFRGHVDTVFPPREQRKVRHLIRELQNADRRRFLRHESG